MLALLEVGRMISLEDIKWQLQNIMLEIGNNLKEKMRDNIIKMDAVASGRLRDSIEVRRISDTEVSVYVDCPYASYVEYGREPSERMPPIRPLVEWLMVKFGYNYDDAKKIAPAIARKIKEKGTKPKPFMRKAISELKRELER